jgi:hypothetical protein
MSTPRRGSAPLLEIESRDASGLPRKGVNGRTRGPDHWHVKDVYQKLATSASASPTRKSGRPQGRSCSSRGSDGSSTGSRSACRYLQINISRRHRRPFALHLTADTRRIVDRDAHTGDVRRPRRLHNVYPIEGACRSSARSRHRESACWRASAGCSTVAAGATLPPGTACGAFVALELVAEGGRGLPVAKCAAGDAQLVGCLFLGHSLGEQPGRPLLSRSLLSAAALVGELLLRPRPRPPARAGISTSPPGRTPKTKILALSDRHESGSPSAARRVRYFPLAPHGAAE